MEPKGSLPCSQDPASSTSPSQMNPVHIFPPYFSKIYSNIILPSTPVSSELSLPFRFSNKNIVCSYVSHACYMSRPSYFPWFDQTNNICCSSLCSLVQPLATFFLLGPNFILGARLLCESAWTLFRKPDDYCRTMSYPVQRSATNNASG